MQREKGGRWKDRLKRALVKSLEKSGTVLTLRKGFQIAGHQTIECMAGYSDDERTPRRTQSLRGDKGLSRDLARVRAPRRGGGRR